MEIILCRAWLICIIIWFVVSSCFIIASVVILMEKRDYGTLYKLDAIANILINAVGFALVIFGYILTIFVI